MRQKRLCALMLVASMAAGVLGGCGNGEAADTSSVSGGTESAGSGTSGDVVELTFYNADGQEDPWTDPVAQALTEATGVKLKTDYPVSADDEKVPHSMIAAGDKYPGYDLCQGGCRSTDRGSGKP